MEQVIAARQKILQTRKETRACWITQHLGHRDLWIEYQRIVEPIERPYRAAMQEEWRKHINSGSVSTAVYIETIQPISKELEEKVAAHRQEFFDSITERLGTDEWYADVDLGYRWKPEWRPNGI